MPVVAKLSRAFAVMFGIVALFWLSLPGWQAAAGMYEGGETIIVCWFIAGFFVVVGCALFFCYRVTRSGELGKVARAVAWSFVGLAGLIGAAMIFQIIWSFVP